MLLKLKFTHKLISLCPAGLTETPPESPDIDTAGYCLTLPGKKLYLTPLLAQKKFRKKGNKDGAVRAFYLLQEEGLGKVLEVAGSKGACVSIFTFHQQYQQYSQTITYCLYTPILTVSITISCAYHFFG